MDCYTWLEYYTRRRTKEETWLLTKKFRQIQWELPNPGANVAAGKLVDTIEKLMDEYCPLKLIKVKSTDDPWIDDDTRRIAPMLVHLFVVPCRLVASSPYRIQIVGKVFIFFKIYFSDFLRSSF